jgi:hypothetical protein
MKFKDDEWLTDYINALHFTVRRIETQTADRNMADALKDQSDALIQEAVLSDIPMEVFQMQRITGRVAAVRRSGNLIADGADNETDNETLRLKTYSGDVCALAADYAFLCQGLEEFTLQDMIEETAPYLEKIYPDLKDVSATVQELFQRDIDLGRIKETGPGLYRQSRC